MVYGNAVVNVSSLLFGMQGERWISKLFDPVLFSKMNINVNYRIHINSMILNNLVIVNEIIEF